MTRHTNQRGQVEPAASLPRDVTEWCALARRDPLAVVVELDAISTIDDGMTSAFAALQAVRIRIAITSDRSVSQLAILQPLAPGAWWFAEHGRWRYTTKWDGPERAFADPAALASWILAELPDAHLLVLGRGASPIEAVPRAIWIDLHDERSVVPFLWWLVEARFTRPAWLPFDRGSAD